MKELKRKMSKEEVRSIKKVAQKRKNRRLEEGEAARLMAKATGVLALRDTPDDLQIIDHVIKTDRLCIPDTCLHDPRKPVVPPKAVTSNIPGVNAAKKNNKVKSVETLFTVGSTEAQRKNLNSNKKNRRLTNRQYKSLMKKAEKELGLREDDIGVLDLEHFEEDYFGEEKPLQRVIDSLLSRGYSDLIKEYRNLVRNKKVTRCGDKLSIINYLLHKPILDERSSAGDKARATFKIPMCLIPKNDRIDRKRNYEMSSLCVGGVQIARHLHKRGDIKERPFRIIPDEEYFLEINSERNLGKRTKFDAFDRMSQDKKIAWARAANLITRIGTDDIIAIKDNVKSESDVDVALFAMKYACKVMSLPEFQGRFKNPYWILYRIIRYHMEMTSKENGLFCKMSSGYASLDPKKTIPIINEKTAIQRLIPTLMKLKLYKDFIEQSKPGISKLALANKLIMEKNYG